jgi:hypothetical protein
MPSPLHALVPHAFAVTQLYQSSWLAQSFTTSSQSDARSVVHVAEACEPEQPHSWFANATHSGRGPLLPPVPVLGGGLSSLGGGDDGPGGGWLDAAPPFDPLPLVPSVAVEPVEPLVPVDEEEPLEPSPVPPSPDPGVLPPEQPAMPRTTPTSAADAAATTRECMASDTRGGRVSSLGLSRYGKDRGSGRRRAWNALPGAKVHGRTRRRRIGPGLALDRAGTDGSSRSPDSDGAADDGADRISARTSAGGRLRRSATAATATATLPKALARARRRVAEVGRRSGRRHELEVRSAAASRAGCRPEREHHHGERGDEGLHRERTVALACRWLAVSAMSPGCTPKRDSSLVMNANITRDEPGAGSGRVLLRGVAVTVVCSGIVAAVRRLVVELDERFFDLVSEGATPLRGYPGARIRVGTAARAGRSAKRTEPRARRGWSTRPPHTCSRR